MVLKGDSCLGRLSNRLNIDKERVAILLLHLYKIAIDVWRNKKDVLVIDRVNEILEVAESKEEAYLLGLLTAIIHNTMVFAVDPYRAISIASSAKEYISEMEKIIEMIEVEDDEG